MADVIDSGELVAIIGLALTVGGLIWRAAEQSGELKALRRDHDSHVAELAAWRLKHEPTAVQLASMQATLTALQGTLSKIEEDIQRLYDRRPRGTS